jgi:hypothetical protein
MAREKKITIKPTLNQRVKGRRDSPLSEMKYPLYLEISYNRKFTKFPFGNNWLPLSEEDNLQNNETLKGAINAVKNVIRYEIRRDEDFEIKGIARTVESYLSPFQSTTLLLLIQHIRIELEEILPVSKLENWKSLLAIDQIKSGLDLLKGNDVNLINDLLSSYQLLHLSGFEDNIMTWLIYTSEKEREAVVRRGLDKLKSTHPPFEEHGGIVPASKKMSPATLSAALTQIAHLVTDSQIVITAQIIQI